MAQRDAGISNPGENRRRLGRRIAGYAVLLLLIAPLAGWIALGWLPDGIRVKGPATYEGMLHIWNAPTGIMSFTTTERLRKNQAVQAKGQYESELICVDAPPDQFRRIEEALKGVPRGSSGIRTLWVRVVAERRLGAWPCARHYGPGRPRRTLGTLLRIVSIVRIRPLGCDSAAFEMNHLRCPQEIQVRRPRHYPEAALRAGKEGSVIVHGRVGADGSLLSCEVLRSSGDRALDSATCDLLRERPDLVAKLELTGVSGTRNFRQRIDWRLPNKPPVD